MKCDDTKEGLRYCVRTEHLDSALLGVKCSSELHGADDVFGEYREHSCCGMGIAAAVEEQKKCVTAELHVANVSVERARVT